MANPPSAPLAVSTGLGKPFLGHPIEICIVTVNLKETLDGLLSLGIGPFKICKFNPKTVANQTFRGQEVEFAIDVAFAEQGKMVWEVMQPISGPSLMQEFLDSTNGRGGIQHISFDCTDGQPENGGVLVGERAHDEAVRRRREFEKRGFPLAQSGIWSGKNGTCEFMFFDTDGAINTCFESYVFSDDWADPEDTEYYPASKPTSPHCTIPTCKLP